LKVESGVKGNAPFEAQGKEALSGLRFAESGNDGKKNGKKKGINTEFTEEHRGHGVFWY
jgi:hypothetical protein